MPGNKREQNATRRDMKFAAIENKLLILLGGRGGHRWVSNGQSSRCSSVKRIG
jgi:hypothetical protein